MWAFSGVGVLVPLPLPALLVNSGRLCSFTVSLTCQTCDDCYCSLLLTETPKMRCLARKSLFQLQVWRWARQPSWPGISGGWHYGMCMVQWLHREIQSRQRHGAFLSSILHIIAYDHPTED